MNDAPERIWAFYAPEVGDDNEGCTIVAGDMCMHGAAPYVRADIHDRLCAEWADASQNNYQIAKGAVAERDALAAALTTMGVDPASIIAALAALP